MAEAGGFSLLALLLWPPIVAAMSTVLVMGSKKNVDVPKQPIGPRNTLMDCPGSEQDAKEVASIPEPVKKPKKPLADREPESGRRDRDVDRRDRDRKKCSRKCRNQEGKVGKKSRNKNRKKRSKRAKNKEYSDEVKKKKEKKEDLQLDDTQKET